MPNIVLEEMTRAELMRHALSVAALLSRKEPRAIVSRHLRSVLWFEIASNWKSMRERRSPLPPGSRGRAARDQFNHRTSVEDGSKDFKTTAKV
jgi:hypothetical protein